MKRAPSSSWTGLLRFGAIAAVIVALPVAALLFYKPPQAEAATPSAEATAAVQTIDKVTIAVTVKNPNDKKLSGPLQVELLDADGKVLATSEKQIELNERTGSYDFEFPVKDIKPAQTRLRCKFGKEEVVTDLPKVLLVKAHETSIAAGQDFYPGSTAALRCEVHGVKSLVENVPLPNSTVEVTLKGKDGKSYPLYSGKTADDGGTRAEFQVPQVAAGKYVLEVATKSALGEEKLTRDVQVKSEPKILLVTDKPLYQPGQLMHVRAMCLRPFDLTPVDATDLLFEIEDPKGNKVFKRTLKTSDFGVAAVDFQLADEVNMGAYQVRAAVGNEQSQKTVEVKKYVLPKFKTEIKADKTFYLPKETIVADIQSDYFFGKPVAKAKLKVTASTFDVQFKDFQTANITTDETGHAKIEIKLPDYFVGQPLQKGDALVKLEVKITDTADHTETVTKTIPVAEQPIRVSLIPEGGHLVPGIENRIFAAAVYPDGSPVAKCEVTLWKGTDPKAKPATTTKTNDSGLAEFRLTPKPEEFRQGQWVKHKIEMLGGVAPQAWGPQSLFDVTVAAKDAKGATAKAVASLNSEPFGENVLLRLDKAIYRAGDAVKIDILTSAGLPTTYLDVVKGGQTMLTRWLDVKDGKASDKIELPAAVFGTLEIHAYQTLASGEIIRDSRVIYVHPRQDLKIDAKADRDVYTPGQSGKIIFTVTDAQGKPTAAALGVIVVDEAVYALQEMQPGLEKVYFTLQEELLKPQAQNAAPGFAPPFGGPPIGPGFGGGGPRPPMPAPLAAGPAEFKPNTSLDALVRDGELPAEKQQIAEVLLTAVKPKPPVRWQHDPAAERKQKFATQVQQIANAALNYAQSSGKPAFQYDKDAKTTTWKRELLDDMVKANYLPKESLKDPFGKPVTLDSLAQAEKRFTAQDLATGITRSRMNMLHTALAWYAGANAAKFQKDGKWEFPPTALTDAPNGYWGSANWTQDAWGNLMKLVKRDKKIEHKMGNNVFDFHEIVSAGPDGKFDTDDDIRSLKLDAAQLAAGQLWFGNPLQGLDGDNFAWNRRDALQKGMALEGMMFDGRGAGQGRFGGGGLPGGGGGFPPNAPGLPMAGAAHGGPQMDPGKSEPGADKAGAAAHGTAAPTRLREYFPETLLWRPTLITDGKGRAEMAVDFADSITTWRLTASANSKNGGLGGMTAPLRVFQDFFVDLDLPVALTQNDEVSFPVAVYNYLKEPQTVKLELQQESWFELLEGDATRSLDLKPNEVTSVKFRIKARKIGFNPLTVKAAGSKVSDAVKRSVEVVPDGQKVEQVVSDKLGGKVKQTLTIPENALPDASKLIVKMYPGVFSQVLEGTEGMLRMPGGCMEQTSSSAYPNVLVVDYLKKTRTASPQLMMTAENYLNVGYQRLLTFERPGGGFDWWGSGPPLVWLSAYGLQEFSDMAKVYPIDKGVIDRTQKYLMSQQNADGTWDKIGATHAVTIEHMGDAKLVLTSYVVWSLVDSGLRSAQLEKSIQYLRDHVNDAKDNAYVLALMANALVAWDAKDDSTHAVLKKLDGLKKNKAEWKAVCFPCADGARTMCYAGGDSVTVETTALTALALIRSGEFTESANRALVYLVKMKDGSGTWGSTQATILSLKALVAGLGSQKQKGKAEFTVVVNGKEVAKGEVTPENADVLQMFDLKEHTKIGANDIEIEVKGETNMMYQVVARHFAPWDRKPLDKPVLDVSVEYDRTKLSTADLLKAKATLRYNGDQPTYQVIVDLGIPPGFTVDPGDFAEMVAAKKVEKFSVTARQVTLYIGDTKPGEVKTFEYSLKPKYPIRAKTPATVAYEYYTPANRAAAKPVELTVEK